MSKLISMNFYHLGSECLMASIIKNKALSPSTQANTVKRTSDLAVKTS